MPDPSNLSACPMADNFDDGDHEVDCKTEQGGFMLKACCLRKY